MLSASGVGTQLPLELQVNIAQRLNWFDLGNYLSVYPELANSVSFWHGLLTNRQLLYTGTETLGRLARIYRNSFYRVIPGRLALINNSTVTVPNNINSVVTVSGNINSAVIGDRTTVSSNNLQGRSAGNINSAVIGDRTTGTTTDNVRYLSPGNIINFAAIGDGTTVLVSDDHGRLVVGNVSDQWTLVSGTPGFITWFQVRNLTLDLVTMEGRYFTADYQSNQLVNVSEVLIGFPVAECYPLPSEGSVNLWLIIAGNRKLFYRYHQINTTTTVRTDVTVDQVITWSRYAYVLTTNGGCLDVSSLELLAAIDETEELVVISEAVNYRPDVVYRDPIVNISRDRDNLLLVTSTGQVYLVLNGDVQTELDHYQLDYVLQEAADYFFNQPPEQLATGELNYLRYMLEWQPIRLDAYQNIRQLALNTSTHDIRILTRSRTFAWSQQPQVVVNNVDRFIAANQVTWLIIDD